MDLKSRWESLQDSLNDCFFIGCFSDGSNPEYMWKKYSHDNGVCVWFEPDYSVLRRIVYEDYLLESDHLRRKYNDLMYRLSVENYSVVEDDIKNAVEELVNLSIMSFYTKKPEFFKESEWRAVIPKSPGMIVRKDNDGFYFIIDNIPGKIVKIESRMPSSCNKKLESALDSTDIQIVYSGMYGCN